MIDLKLSPMKSDLIKVSIQNFELLSRNQKLVEDVKMLNQKIEKIEIEYESLKNLYEQNQEANY
jgi:hypothetical protein